MTDAPLPANSPDGYVRTDIADGIGRIDQVAELDHKIDLLFFKPDRRFRQFVECLSIIAVRCSRLIRMVQIRDEADRHPFHCGIGKQGRGLKRCRCGCSE